MRLFGAHSNTYYYSHRQRPQEDFKWNTLILFNYTEYVSFNSVYFTPQTSTLSVMWFVVPPVDTTRQNSRIEGGRIRIVNQDKKTTEERDHKLIL